jgi:uncharacterized ferritin-like protein (DUF455 family)
VTASVLHEASRDDEVTTIDRWAIEYIASTSLAHKVAPPPLPTIWSASPKSIRVASPGRPRDLQIEERAHKTRGLATPHGRARALHAFWHHELQAAELMLWAALAFADAPTEFRDGLVRIAVDEIRHMTIYAAQIERLGSHLGDFAVRDWFWQRVPACADPASFCAVMGLGLESANLDHSSTFAQKFRDVGDEEGARAQELVGLEEIAHARFGAIWFQRFAGALDFESWSRSLPAPLSPMLMRGRPLQRNARKKAGQSDPFLDALERWEPIDASPGT